MVYLLHIILIDGSQCYHRLADSAITAIPYRCQAKGSDNYENHYFVGHLDVFDNIHNHNSFYEFIFIRKFVIFEFVPLSKEIFFNFYCNSVTNSLYFTAFICSVVTKAVMGIEQAGRLC